MAERTSQLNLAYPDPPTVEIPANECEVAYGLWATSPEHSPRSFALAPGMSMVLGSARDADIRVKDRTVSARHCRIDPVPAGIRITDLRSRNGVWLGHAKVQEALIAPGGGFEVGRTRIDLVQRDSGSGPAEPPLPGLVGTSKPMRELAGWVRRFAPLELPVLIRGESGSGKELVARAIHDEGRNSTGPFIAINAATLTRELAESELFGHERGAFTGAVRGRRGAFQLAHGGTLFLDEIGSLPLDVQAKLLRAVEEGTIRPVGAERSEAVHVRLVAATCEPLETMLMNGRFRPDLYERIAVCVVGVPPLRDRRGDIPALCDHLLRAADLGHRPLTSDARALLSQQEFVGNVRELRNILVQAAVLGHGVIGACDIGQALRNRHQRMMPAERIKPSPANAIRLLAAAGGNVSAAARSAGLPRSTMRDLLRSASASA